MSNSTTMSVNKLIFGAGSKLKNDDYQPSIYSLSSDNTMACLAADFSKYEAATIKYDDIFNKTDAVRISGDSLYNQVAFLSSGEKQQKCEEAESGDSCGEILERAEKVNLVSLTVLALRLIFLKTVVFNVLLTLRIWISQ